jgi:hydrogenase maturation protein HypF
MTSAIHSHIGSDQRERIQLTIRGTVQGIGFRPFVFRLAQELALGGWIANTTQGTLLELEGTQNRLRAFQKRITTEIPFSGNIQAMSSSSLSVICEQSFFIRPSQLNSQAQSVISPDLATCEAAMALDFFGGEQNRANPALLFASFFGDHSRLRRDLGG